MSDQYGAAGFKGAGQPPQSAPQSDAPTPAQPQYLTYEQAQAMAKEAEEAAFRRAQGLIEKSSSRVLKQVQADLNTLEQSLSLQRKAGLEVSPEMEDKLKQQVMQKAFQNAPIEENAPSPVSTSPQAGQPVMPAEQDVDRVNRQAYQMMQEIGVMLEDNDPELQLINHGNEAAYLSSIVTASNAKKARLATSQATARVASPVQGTGRPDLMQAYLKEVESATNQSQRLDIRRKYRNLGLPL